MLTMIQYSYLYPAYGFIEYEDVRDAEVSFITHSFEYLSAIFEILHVLQEDVFSLHSE